MSIVDFVFRDDLHRLCIPESIVDFYGGRNTREERRTQPVEDDIDVCQKRETRTREHKPKTEAKWVDLSHFRGVGSLMGDDDRLVIWVITDIP